MRRTAPSGTHQNRSERDAFATLHEDRLAQLMAVEDRLAFGRLDLTSGARRYVGRLGLSDDEQTQLLVDWRAPAARSFYQATAASPGDVVRRRHLATRERTVVGVEDEVLDLEHMDGDERATLSGEGALLAAIGSARTGRMADIVATIQGEQDRVIRSDLAGVLVVQGGPEPARQLSRCIAPPTCSTRIANGWRAAACSSSGPTRCSSATSSRCFPRSARPAS